MRLRNIPDVREKIKAEYAHIVLENACVNRGRWQAYFQKDHPIHLEIGMGKGKFLQAMSLRAPDINFVALELRPEMIYTAAKRVGDHCPNVAMVEANARELAEIFAPGEVARIYLNFSDPWPKKRHWKRRLTHRNFLYLYRTILAEGGEILFRTDVAGLMEFTLVEMAQSGFCLNEVSLQFHDSPYFNGIMTEYEEKKSKNGPIYYGRFRVLKGRDSIVSQHPGADAPN